MTSAVLLATLFLPLQNLPVEGPGSVPPVGSSGGFQSLALAVRQAAKGDRAKAARLATMLPVRDPAIFWDDRNVPEVSREAFRNARDYALAEWGRLVPDLNPRIVTSAKAASRGLVFSFEPRLARAAGATHFLGVDTTRPRLETVIGLRRGEFYTGEVDVHNEVLFALGTYFGVLPNPSFGGAMGRTDVRAVVATSPRSYEAMVAQGALLHAADLRTKLAKKTPLSAGVPKLWTEAKTFDLGTTLQGTPVETSFAISNNGTAPMDLAIQGDCGCISAVGPIHLGPGESGVVRARYDTSALGGAIKHGVIIRTTDPEIPERFVPLHLAVRTLARFIVPAGTTVAAAPGTPIEMFLIFDPSKPQKVGSIRVDGVAGDSTFEPWSGTLADPLLSEGPLPRVGYRVRFVPKTVKQGTSLITATATTEAGERIVGNVFLQRGIVATPPVAAFSDPGTTPGRVELQISRRGAAFRILSVKVEGKGLTATVVRPGVESESHTVALLLDPAALLPGQPRRLIVQTNDPAQPQIVVRVTIPEQ